LTAKK
jgi:hypothetical protein